MITLRLYGRFILIGVVFSLPGIVWPDIAVVVNPRNPVKVLDSEAVKRIFNGTLRTFPSTGMVATALDQPQSMPVHLQFYKLMLKTTPARMKRRRAAYLFSGQGIIPEIVENDAAVKAAVLKKPTAIGYINASAVDDSVVVVYTVRD